ncbi:MAG: hypothetical protein M5U35_03055 [Roseovarius sp.]|nr:hypothetical protein [Roseovarius sp.]
MSPKRKALFVQRRTYRRRRLADGARLLPLVGAVLFMIPLLWQGAEPSGGETPALRDGERTARVMTYLFLVWLGLAVLSGVLSRYLRSDADEGGTAGRH